MGCGNSKGVVSPRKTLPQTHTHEVEVLPKLKEEPAKIPEIKREKTCIAFDISFNDSNQKEMNSEIDNILKKPLPKKLQHLEPLQHAPRLTAADIERKMKQAEEKRLKKLEKRKIPGRKASRRREQIMSTHHEAVVEEELYQKMDTVEQKRLQKLAEIQEKQRQRDERARIVRERKRAQKLSGEDDTVAAQEQEIMTREIPKGVNHDDIPIAPRPQGNLDNEGAGEVNTNEELDSQQSSGYNSRDASASSKKSEDDVQQSNAEDRHEEEELLETSDNHIVKDEDVSSDDGNESLKSEPRDKLSPMLHDESQPQQQTISHDEF